MEKMVGEYQVVASVNVGKKEIFLAINEQEKEDGKYLCGFAERNDLFELYNECVSGDDYTEIAQIFGSRIANEAEKLQEEVRKLGIPIEVLTIEHCSPDDYKNDINGKVVVIRADILKPEYRRADRQLYLVTGGFGASANSRGSAVFCANIHTGESTRYERRDVLGVIKPEYMPEWAKDKAELLAHAYSSDKLFQYADKWFCPYRRLTKGEAAFSDVSKNIASDPTLGIMVSHYPGSKFPYEYKDFYAAAGEKKCDLFVCRDNGKLYLPGENELFEWRGEKGNPDKEFLKEPKQKPRKKDYER